LEPIVEQPVLWSPQVFGLSVDTVGQERMLSHAQRLYVVQVVKHLKSTYEKNQLNALNEIVKLVKVRDNVKEEMEESWREEFDNYRVKAREVECPYNEDSADH